jgi:hypothetical protein
MTWENEDFEGGDDEGFVEPTPVNYRDYISAHVLAALVVNPNNATCAEIAKLAVAYADALIAELEKE